jgi:SPP1 gp7 family putative phage head morphogenesis protein
MRQFFDNYKVQQLTPAGNLEDITDIKGRLNTVVRTNLSDAYTMGSLESYNDPNISDFIVAYEYSAIIDDRTTDFCKNYDGRIYAKDDPIWDSLKPPNHFNCRSVIIPILVGDEYKVSKPLAIKQPQGFGG